MKRPALIVLTALVALAAAPGYKVIDKIKIGGAGGWDYVYVDSDANRVYVSHTNQTEVIDTVTNKLVGTIPDTTGVHGIAVASDLGKGFTSNGRANNVTIFDLKTLMATGTIATGMNPDAILYEPGSHRLFTFNGRGNDATVIDAKTGTVISTLPVGGKPEFAQYDGKGKVYFNVENTSEIAELDAAKAAITKRIPLAPCEEPSGLAIDRQKRRLFAVCSNRKMVMVDPDGGKVIGSVDIGPGADGAAFDNGFAFSSNGGDGTMTVVQETSPGKFEVVETVQTARTARTIGADPKTHKLYLPAAEQGPPPAGGKGRGTIVPDSFHILIVGR
ncbi:MAG: YncE family protein [Acidobacteriia bacterium]|nr:YncE family protein [Terriglobia bacterium]